MGHAFATNPPSPFPFHSLSCLCTSWRHFIVFFFFFCSLCGFIAFYWDVLHKHTRPKMRVNAGFSLTSINDMGFGVIYSRFLAVHQYSGLTRDRTVKSIAFAAGGREQTTILMSFRSGAFINFYYVIEFVRFSSARGCCWCLQMSWHETIKPNVEIVGNHGAILSTQSIINKYKFVLG